MQVPLILASNCTRIAKQNELSENSVPRRDYVEIARKLGAKLSGYDLSDSSWYRWTRQIEKRIKLDLVETLFAAGQCSKHNAILSASEKIAIPLAAYLSITRREMPHVVIAHKLSSRLKSRLFRIWPLHKTFSHVICVCQAQADYAIHQLGLPESRVDFIYDKVDHRFFHPLKVEGGDYILAVGQEQRDYETLLRAISGTGIKLVIVASSPWSTSRIRMDEIKEVSVLSHIPYQELRTLYAKARLVVVPLFSVDYAAGANSVLEAMAMAKPLIISRTSGITDYVVDGETGILVNPGDMAAMREAVQHLLARPEEACQMGRNARQRVEEELNLDMYVERIANIVSAHL